MIDVDKGHVQLGLRSVLRPIVGLTENLPKLDLERITIEAIKEHRRLRDIAEAKHEQCWPAVPVAADAESVGPERLAYVKAMIDVHAQQSVLSLLLDVLGYIPEVPSDEEPEPKSA